MQPKLHNYSIATDPNKLVNYMKKIQIIILKRMRHRKTHMDNPMTPGRQHMRVGGNLAKRIQSYRTKDLETK